MKTVKLIHVVGAVAGLCLIAGAGASLAPAPAVWLAKDLIGMKVVSQQGESLGKIEDVVVHPGGAASYAVLSFGGMLGMGNKLFAMPWTVLHTMDSAEEGSAPSLVLPLAKERLEKAPGFAKGSWPTMANADWAKDIDAFYAGAANPDTKRVVEASARASVISWRVSELKGTEVRTPAGDELGDIKELAIDANGRVSYAVLSVGGFLGIGDRLVAVPWDSLTFALTGEEGSERRITLASTKTQLENAPRFEEGKEHAARMCDPKWIEHVYEYFSCPPYVSAPRETAGASRSSR